MNIIAKYDGSIRQETVPVNHLGSKEDAKEKFLAVRMVQNSDKVRYFELKIYMHNSYVNGKDRWPKTMPAALNVIVNWKGGKMPPVQQYESSEGVALTTKDNPGGFRGY